MKKFFDQKVKKKTIHKFKYIEIFALFRAKQNKHFSLFIIRKNLIYASVYLT